MAARRVISPARKGKKTRQHRAADFVLERFDRVALLMFVIALLGALVSVRLFMVQVVEHSFYEALASGQHELVQKLIPDRGEIYSQDKYSESGLTVIATNRTLQHVYANPRQLEGADHEAIAIAIAPILGMDPEVVKERISRPNDSYEPLKHQVTDPEIAALEALTAPLGALEAVGMPGIHWIPEEARFYPEGEISSSVTGFVGYVDNERKGQYGLEGRYDTELSGTEGSLSAALDSSGRFIAVADNNIVEAQDGETIILTIDKNIQYKACSVLAKAVEKHGATQGSVVIMHPETGAILALCNAPLYDPNNYGEVEDIGVFSNDAVADQYEPGSVFKAITMAAGLNEDAVTPYTTYEDTGVVEVGGYKIRNSDGKANGVVDMTKVLEDSLNTGSIFVANKVGNARWHQYLKDFGFGETTEIDISGELGGTIAGVAEERDIYTATSSYGQGITVTPVQLVQAFGALANDGVMMQPHIIERRVMPNGYQQVTEPEVVGQPIQADAAQTVSAMLVRVIEGGHAILAQVDGYHMAGKTGTAQIPREDGPGYYANKHKDTFIGYGPVSDPEFVMLVKIDDPKDVQWSAASAAPVFGEIATYLVNYMQIPPDAVE